VPEAANVTENKDEKPGLESLWELPLKLSSAYLDALRVATLFGNGVAR